MSRPYMSLEGMFKAVDLGQVPMVPLRQPVRFTWGFMV